MVVVGEPCHIANARRKTAVTTMAPVVATVVVVAVGVSVDVCVSFVVVVYVLVRHTFNAGVVLISCARQHK